MCSGRERLIADHSCPQGSGRVCDLRQMQCQPLLEPDKRLRAATGHGVSERVHLLHTERRHIRHRGLSVKTFLRVKIQ